MNENKMSSYFKSILDKDLSDIERELESVNEKVLYILEAA